MTLRLSAKLFLLGKNFCNFDCNEGLSSNLFRLLKYFLLTFSYITVTISLNELSLLPLPLAN